VLQRRDVPIGFCRDIGNRRDFGGGGSALLASLPSDFSCTIAKLLSFE
jgi:hypothetical protein